jgi:hypothetical protein
MPFDYSIVTHKFYRGKEIRPSCYFSPTRERMRSVLNLGAAAGVVKKISTRRGNGCRSSLGNYRLGGLDFPGPQQMSKVTTAFGSHSRPSFHQPSRAASVSPRLFPAEVIPDDVVGGTADGDDVRGAVAVEVTTA